MPALLALLACGAFACAPAARANTPTIVIGGSEPEPTAPPSSAATVEPPPPPRKPSGPIVWEISERAARERARRGLPLIVWARADWAAPALEMERRVWTDAEVVAAARPFVALRLDLTEAEGDAERYAEQYGINRMPMTVIFDARGKRVAALSGAATAAALAAALRRATE